MRTLSNSTEEAIAWMQGENSGEFLETEDFNFFKHVTNHLVRHATQLQEKGSSPSDYEIGNDSTGNSEAEAPKFNAEAVASFLSQAAMNMLPKQQYQEVEESWQKCLNEETLQASLTSATKKQHDLHQAK